MSNQMSLWDLPNATFSQGSGDGRSPCERQDGQMIGQYGQDPAHANLSARQALEAGCLMSGTSGRTGTTSSTSAALQQYLESRLQAKTASAGSTLYRLTWKQRDTPLQRQICALRASAHRTSGKGSGSSGWPTPQMRDFRSGGEDRASNPGRSNNLNDFVLTAGWATPRTRDYRDTGNLETSMHRQTGQLRDDTVPRQAWMAGWPTLRASDGLKGARTLSGCEAEMERKGRLDDLPSMVAWSVSNGPARFTADGQMLTGCSAEMESGGQLNPAHSRWLMGYPPEWDDCGVTAMPSSRKPRKQLSKV
jgi:hypothetical protein